MFWSLASTVTLFSIISTTTAWALPAFPSFQHPLPHAPATFPGNQVVTPHLCPDNTTQYSGYLPGSPLFFWFFPSRSSPSTDPVGIWSNGGPGSSALTGMQYAGPCEVVEDGNGGYEMERREWSLNQRASILMVDNPLGAGFSFAPFPAVHSVYDSAKDLYDFLQLFLDAFPEYATNSLAINSLSYGGHYAPAYSSYIQHMNTKLAGRKSLWDDIWPLPPTKTNDHHLGSGMNRVHPRILNLTSISIGNGWINSRVQYRALIDFACGGATERGVPMLADAQNCEWARNRLLEGEALMDDCKSPAACVAAGLYTEQAAGFPYGETALNPYDHRRKTAYDESAIIAYYNNATVQAQLGVIASAADVPKYWPAHSSRVHMEYVYSGDWDRSTDVLFERLLRSGVAILKYEGMVDWVCNYLGIRQIMSNLPNFKHQAAFNNLSMVEWTPQASDTSMRHPRGAYKCLLADNDELHEGNLCYLELEGVGHVASLDKPMETSEMISRWMHDLKL